MFFVCIFHEFSERAAISEYNTKNLGEELSVQSRWIIRENIIRENIIREKSVSGSNS